MNICNEKHHDKKAPHQQVFVHVRESETPMRDVRRLILDVLLQYQEADKAGYALGVLDKKASFSDSIPWCHIVSRLDHEKNMLDKVSKEHLTESVSFLDELVNTFNEKFVLKIQKYRDQWMRRVMLLDVLAFSTMLIMIAAGLYYSGIGFNSEEVFAVIKERPLFYMLAGVAGSGLLVALHYFIRHVVMNNMLDKMQDKLLPGTSLQKALLRNARIQHSIFRPEPVGWNFRQKKRLEAIKNEMGSLREMLNEVINNYLEQEAA